MTEVQALWMDWTYDGRGWYLVNDPEVTFYGEEEAIAYCDEHNRALVENALAENARLRNALFRAIQKNEHCDDIECVDTFSEVCHCRETFVAALNQKGTPQ